MIYSGTGLYAGETMTIRKTFLVSAALLASAALQPALAQASFASGAKVSDTAGGAVGTIPSVDGEFVILKKDKNAFRLPTASFTSVEDGLLQAMIQAQVKDRKSARWERGCTYG